METIFCEAEIFEACGSATLNGALSTSVCHSETCELIDCSEIAAAMIDNIDLIEVIF